MRVTDGSIRGVHIALTMEEAAMLMGILDFPEWYVQPRDVRRFCAWLSEGLMQAAGTELEEYPRTADALGMLPRTTVDYAGDENGENEIMD